MKLEALAKLEDALYKEEQRVKDSKRPSYTGGNSDVLWNFKRDADIAGIDPMVAWLILFLKQVAAVASYVKNPDIVPSEPLLSRMVDIRVYAALGLGLAVDEGREVIATEPAFNKPTIHKDGDYE